MIPLEKEFTKYGDTLKQVRRTKDVALYERICSLSGRISWELVIVQKKKKSIMFDRTYEAREAMPSSSQWGSQGWTHVREEDALTAYTDLCVERGYIKSKPLRVRSAKKL